MQGPVPKGEDLEHDSVSNCELYHHSAPPLWCLATLSGCKIKHFEPIIGPRDEYVFGSIVCVILSSNNS